MTDIIIIAIVAVVLILALRSGLKHFRGEGGCCGGGTYKAKEKKLSAVTAKKTAHVEGMSCQHCVNRVMEAVNDIEGASARVNLKKGTVTISMDRPIEDAVFVSAIEDAGYEVKSIG